MHTHAHTHTHTHNTQHTHTHTHTQHTTTHTLHTRTTQVEPYAVASLSFRGHISGRRPVEERKRQLLSIMEVGAPARAACVYFVFPRKHWHTPCSLQRPSLLLLPPLEGATKYRVTWLAVTKEMLSPNTIG